MMNSFSTLINCELEINDAVHNSEDRVYFQERDIYESHKTAPQGGVVTGGILCSVVELQWKHGSMEVR